MRAAVVVLAAGAGTRVGAEVNKVLLPRGRRPGRRPLGAHGAGRARRTTAWCWWCATASRTPSARAVEPFLDRTTRPEVAMVTGGETRHASEWQALSLLAADIEAGEIDVVAMHDAARPLAPPGPLRPRARRGRRAAAARSRSRRSTTSSTSTAPRCRPGWSGCRRRRRSARRPARGPPRGAGATASRHRHGRLPGRLRRTCRSWRSSPTRATSSSPSPTTSRGSLAEAAQRDVSASRRTTSSARGDPARVERRLDEQPPGAAAEIGHGGREIVEGQSVNGRDAR